MKRWGPLAVLATVLMGTGLAWSDEPHGPHVDDQEQMLTGEVVAVWCLIREGSGGIGMRNAAKQMNCINLGSPIALMVGHALYTAVTSDPEIRNLLTVWAGHQVTVHGSVSVENGQPIILVSHVERAGSVHHPAIGRH